MDNAPLNPFQSPEGIEPESHADDLVLGEAVAYEILKVAGCFPLILGVVGVVGVIWLGGTGFRNAIGLFTGVIILLVLSIGGMLIGAVYSSRNAPLMVNRERLRGRVVVDDVTREMDIYWKHISRYHFDRNGYLQLESHAGPTYCFFVGWYTREEKRNLIAYCREQLGSPDPKAVSG